MQGTKRSGVSGSAGMSLIELLVAVAVASIMFTATTQLLFNASKSLTILRKRIDTAQQARLALERMTRELASAFHPYGMYGETGTRADKPWLMIQTAGGYGEEISFISNIFQTAEFEPSTDAKGDLTEIQYHIVAAGSESHLYRRQEEGVLSVLDDNAWAGGTDMMIAQYVKSLDFTMWNKSGVITATNYTGGELDFPSRIRIKITFYDPDDLVADQTFAVDVSTMRNTTSGP